MIGVGYLGRIHAAKYASLPDAELVSVCDVNVNRSQEVASQFGTQAVTDYRDLLDRVEAVSIVTPTLSHFTIAKSFLEAGIHVLVEKPITHTVSEAKELVGLANRNGLILQVGHLERFNSAVNALEKYLDAPSFIESLRLAPFNPRGADVNVVLDLMIHDIDLIQYIVGSPIRKIHANGARVLSGEIDVANARILFENHCVANVTASRASLKTARKLRLFQKEGYISLDLQHKQLALHHKGSNKLFPGVPDIVHEEQVFEQGDALRDEIVAFLNSVRTGASPVVSGLDGQMALATAIEITNIVHEQMALFQAAH